MNPDIESRITKKRCKKCGDSVLIQMAPWLSEGLSISCQECVEKTDDYDIVPCCECYTPICMGKNDFTCLICRSIFCHQCYESENRLTIQPLYEDEYEDMNWLCSVCRK